MQTATTLEPSNWALSSPRRWRDLRWSARVCILVTWTLAVTLVLEMGSRAYWTFAKQVPYFRTDLIWNSYFPEWRDSGVEQAPTDRQDDTVDVLVLGPSVWYFVYGDLAPRFEKALAEKLGKKVKLFNAAHSGRTTRDALLLYRKLQDRRFDLVVVYHGINDHFLNNCPAEVVRDDYTHAPRFQQIHLLEQHPEHGWFSLPYTLRYARSRIGEKLHLDTRPQRESSDLGGHQRIAQGFRANLEEILNLAAQRQDRVLLLTCAYHIPDNYTEEAFAAKTLDYDRHIHPLKTWGTVAAVSGSLETHNRIIADLAKQHPETLFTDMAALLPAAKRNYDDPCHLTPAGCAEFVHLLMTHTDWGKLGR